MNPIVTEPLVSVVVTTRNEERNIENCLRSIQYQTHKNTEIIVVDNNSTDLTKQIASGFTDKIANVGPERSQQRNYGIFRIAQGDFILYLDADMILSPTVIQTCLNQIQSNGDVGLYIDETVLGRGHLATIRRYERRFYTGTVIDAVRFFHRNVFESLNGFDETLPPGPEDWDLDKRVRAVGTVSVVSEGQKTEDWQLQGLIYQLGISHSSSYAGIYHNEDKQSVRRYLSKKKYYSVNMDPYIGKWGKRDPDVRTQLGFRSRYFSIFLKNRNYRYVIARPDLAIQLLLLRIAVGVIYLLSLSKSPRKS
jgi:glycosyltransferase involved in cell wall biosynthesis